MFNEAEEGLTSTVSTGIRTLTEASALSPPLDAVMVTLPSERAVTRPVGVTVARLESELSQLTGLEVRGRPFSAFGMAWNWIDPWGARAAVSGDSSTAATERPFTPNRPRLVISPEVL
jgi:hypothetical protein